jgi:hypothetical protein
MAGLPLVEIEDRRQYGGDWDFRALLRFQNETVAIDLDPGGELRPIGPPTIADTLRRQWLLDNYRPVIEQVRESGPRRTVYFFE